MTDYAGETYEVVVTAEDFDGTSIVPDDIDDITIEIFDKAGEVVVAETTMSWRADDEEWVYTWHTVDYTPGTYKAKVVVHGPAGSISFEVKRLRLARSSV